MDEFSYKCIIGVGKVGWAAIRYLHGRRAEIYAFDIDRGKLQRARSRFHVRIHICNSLPECLEKARLVLLATPGRNLVTASMVSGETVISAPAIPLGLTRGALAKVKRGNLIHDPLQLGVAAMIVELVK